MSIDEIKEKLKDRNLAEIARRLTMHRETLSRLMRGDVKFLSHKNHDALEKYFQENP